MPQFTINCPPDEWEEEKRYFLLGAPNQTLGPGEANLSDNEWIKQKLLLLAKSPGARGRKIEQEEQAQPPTDSAFTIT